MPHQASFRVSHKFLFVNEEVEAELADVEGLAVVLSWEGREVPRLHAMLPKLNELHCLDFSRFLELMDLLLSQTQVLVVLEEVALLLFQLLLLSIELGHLSLDVRLIQLDLVLVAPAVVSTLLSHVVDVVIELEIVGHHNINAFLFLLLGSLLKLLVLVLRLLRDANVNDLREEEVLGVPEGSHDVDVFLEGARVDNLLYRRGLRHLLPLFVWI